MGISEGAALALGMIYIGRHMVKFFKSMPDIALGNFQSPRWWWGT